MSEPKIRLPLKNLPAEINLILRTLRINMIEYTIYTCIEKQNAKPELL